ncbi:cyclin-L1-like [Amblyomma americanum]
MAVMGSQNNVDGAKPKHGKVILLLENCILPPERLLSTPSIVDGLDSNSETDLRILGCELIQTSGKLLRLPQVAMATGQVLFHRFYFSKSFVRHSMEIVAMACITLASKIEEAPRRGRDVINVFHHIKQMKSGKTIQPLILDQNYINLKNQVIKAERRVLKELGFCVHVKHPHKIIVTLLQVLECEKNTKLMQSSWNYMNDSLRTDIFVRYSPETIACACIYLSARLLQIPLPTSPPWYAVFSVTEEDIQDTCRRVLSIYTRKPDPDALEKKIEELKKAHLEAKLRAKMASGISTPILGNGASFSPSSRNNSPRQSPTQEVTATKKKEEAKPAVERSPRVDRTASNYIPGIGAKRKASPSSPSPVRSRKETSRQGHSSSSSNGGSPTALAAPQPARGRTPPRSYKESGSGLSSPVRSKLEDGRSKDSSNSKRHTSHKRKRSASSRSRSRSPSHRHSSKKSSGSSHRTSRHKSSPSGHSEHNHRHHRSSSKKERSRENRNHRTAITARR